MKYLRIAFITFFLSTFIFLPSENSFATEYDTWEENFQQCIANGATDVYIFIVVDESGSLESYYADRPDIKNLATDPKQENGFPKRVTAIEAFIKNITKTSEELTKRGGGINVAIAGFGSEDHSNWQNGVSPYLAFTLLDASSQNIIIDTVKKEFTNDKKMGTFINLPLVGVNKEFKSLPEKSCKVLIFFSDGDRPLYAFGKKDNEINLKSKEYCEAVNNLRKDKNVFLLGVHLSNKENSNQTGFNQLQNIFLNEYKKEWKFVSNATEAGGQDSGSAGISCDYEGNYSSYGKIYSAGEKLALDIIFKDLSGNFNEADLDNTTKGPEKEISLCDENQIKTNEGCLFKFRMGPSARFFSITATLKDGGLPTSVENLSFKVIPPESFSSKEIKTDNTLSGNSETLLNQVEITANYFGTYVRFDFKTISEEPTWVGVWGIAGYQDDNLNKTLNFSSTLTSGYFVELESVDEVFRSGSTHCFDLKIESANKQIENIDTRYYEKINVELYSLATDKPINSSKYSINEKDNGICINFKEVEPQDIKLKPLVDIIGISNPDSSEKFYYPNEPIPRIIQLQDKATPPTIEIFEDENREPSARFGADQVVDFKITGGNVDQIVSWYTDNSADLGEVEIEINGTKYLPSETIDIKAETEYEGSLIFKPRFNNETKNLDFNFGFTIGNTELASSRVVQPYIELPINTILFNSLKYFFLGLIIPLLLLIFFFFNNRYIQFDPGTRYGVVRLQYNRDEDQFKSDDVEPNFDKLKKPGSKNKSEENIKNFTINYKSLFSKTLSISIKNDFRILNNNTLKKSTTLPENESPRGCFIGINNAVAEKSSILIIARNENEFSKYLNEAKEELRKYYSSNQPDLTGHPEPSKPERRGDSGKPGRRGDSGKPGRRGDSGKPGRRGDSGKPGRRGDSGKPERRGDSGKPGRRS